ncbi:MAG: ABC transporter permease, partial [Geminicoccaceae bacterium]
MLRYLPALTVALFLGPVVAGLLGTLLPAFGYLPALGGEELSLEPWRRLLAAPGLVSALRATLISGLLSTALALALTVLIFAAGHGTAALTRVKRGMVPLLAVPHLAIAVGLAFLIAPSGWLIRLVSPWATGWHTPPDFPLVQDPLGLALAFALVLKETPFLILMTFGALGQIGADAQFRMARSLGYGPVQAWLKVILPQVYPQIRLPVYAVLAYALSVVD